MPDRIVASQVKRVDNTCYRFLKEIAEGNFKGGTPVEMGLKEEGVDLLYTTNETLKATIPQEAIDQVEALRKDVIDGKIKVPATKEDFDSFQFPA